MSVENALTWERLREALDRAAVERVTILVARASDERRRAVRAEFEAYARELTTEPGARREPDLHPGLAVAAVGCLPSPARVVALLSRRGLRDRWDDLPVDRLIEVAQSRGESWLPELARRLAGKLGTDPNIYRWRFAAAFLSAAGLAPPTDEGFVRGWATLMLGTWVWREEADVLQKALGRDPYLDALLPRIFEIDGLGGELDTSTWAPIGDGRKEAKFVRVLAGLAAEGRIDRTVLLEGCRGRFLRGDRPGSLRPFVQLHDLLAPGVDELAPHATRYARLLPDAPSPLAALAQRVLRQLDDAGRLEFETLTRASAGLLGRTEKGLIKTQLSWLDGLAKRHPDRAGEVLEAVAVALGHDALDIQERALTVIGRHAGRIGDEARGRLAEQAAGLTGELAERAAGLLGVPVEAELPEAAVGVPGPPPVAPMPAPIAGPAELAEEIVALVHDGLTVVGWERVLAALVDLRAREPDGLRDALTPILTRYGDSAFTESRWGRPSLLAYLGAAMRAATDAEGGWGTVGQRLVAAVRAAWGGTPIGLGMPADPRGPGLLPALRIAELAVQLRRAPVPALVSTPTSVNGQLDAGALVERLRRAEEAGWQPWRLDLTQALLRLPRDTDEETIRAAAGLGSPAGARLAAWLNGGRPADPRSVPTERLRRGYLGGPVDRWLTYALQCVDPPADPPLDKIFELDPRLQTPAVWAEEDSVLWSAALPNDREVVAAWAMPSLAELVDADVRGAADLLPALAECAGPAGPAVSLALAYGLAAQRQADRVAAVDAFLTLTAAPAGGTEDPSGGVFLDRGAFGRELGRLAADGTIKLTRVVPSLTDAARAGAYEAVWTVLEHALPAVLAVAPRGTPDLLALGSQTAPLVARRGPVAEVGEAAARLGSSRLVVEARRLHRILAG